MRKATVLFIILSAFSVCSGDIISVDDDGPADFNNIQSAIDASQDGDIIIVQPGYYEGIERSLDSGPFKYKIIDFNGKNITLTSTNPSNFDVVSSTIIGATVMFKGTEEPNCVLTGFKISHNESTGGIVGIDLTQFPYTSPGTRATISNCVIQKIQRLNSIYLCDGLIQNCVIVDNINISMMPLVPTVSNCHGTIRGCTIARNYCDSAIEVGPDSGHLIIENSIIYGGEQLINVPENCSASISFCDIERGTEGICGAGDVLWGPGNIDVDPCFVEEGFWDANEGDYHLKSEAGRWDPNTQSWVTDEVTSWCIDAGNPGCPLASEPEDSNNLRINMGAFGGTPLASKTPFRWSILSDLNNNGIVNFKDFFYLSNDWLNNGECMPGDLNRDNIINISDVALFTYDWLEETIWY
jgi:hypothetical protein